MSVFARFWAFPYVFRCFVAFGAILAARGTLLDVLGTLLDALGGLLGALGTLLGALGALLGRSWGALEAMLGLSCKKTRKKQNKTEILMQLGRQNGTQNH